MRARYSRIARLIASASGVPSRAFSAFSPSSSSESRKTLVRLRVATVPSDVCLPRYVIQPLSPARFNRPRVHTARQVAARNAGHGRFRGMLILVVALLVAQSTPPPAPPKPAVEFPTARGAKRTPFMMEVKDSTTIITAHGEVEKAVLVTEKDETFAPKKTEGEKGTVVFTFTHPSTGDYWITLAFKDGREYRITGTEYTIVRPSPKR